MRTKTFTAAGLAALMTVLTLAGCGNKPAATTTAATSAAETTTTAAAAETTTTTGTKESADIEVQLTEDDDAGTNGTVIFTDLSGNTYNKEDAVAGEWDITFPYTSVRVSTGMYIDSDTEPGKFDVENFSYSGDKAECGDLVMVKAGDTVGGLKIASANTRLNLPWNDELGGLDPNATEGFMLGSSSVDIEGEVTLTGVIRYYYDEMYAVASGDISFIPDSSYAGMPMATNIAEGEMRYGAVNFDEVGSGLEDDWGNNLYGGGVNVYSDAHVFHVGNLNTDYTDRTDLVELFDGAAANCTKKVQVTLTDVHIEWNDNFGSAYACSGRIKDAAVLG